jgi:tripartite-type tricarboxylate transporter receptor subunit TctC
MLNQIKKFAASGSTIIVMLAAASAPAHSASFPCTALKIVSPYPPGGTTDILARMLIPSLQKSLGIPIIVENKAGASSNIGTQYRWCSTLIHRSRPKMSKNWSK